MVMEFLIKEGYPLAAQSFSLEANMTPMPDLDAIEERVNIREAIYSRDIKSAIEMVNEIAPQVSLSTCGPTTSHFPSPVPLAMIRPMFMHHSYCLRAGDDIKHQTTSVFSMSNSP